MNVAELRLKGVKFVGINGNSIFIPRSGLCKDSLITNRTILPLSDCYGERDCRGMSIDCYVSCGGLSDEVYKFNGLTVRGVKNGNNSVTINN
jgi:hypothetical protein